MKFELAALACALALTPRADHAAPERLGIEDASVLKTGVGALQNEAAGAVDARWVDALAIGPNTLPVKRTTRITGDTDCPGNDACKLRLLWSPARTVERYLRPADVTVPGIASNRLLVMELADKAWLDRVADH
jgi:hypothetical protein